MPRSSKHSQGHSPTRAEFGLESRLDEHTAATTGAVDALRHRSKRVNAPENAQTSEFSPPNSDHVSESELNTSSILKLSEDQLHILHELNPRKLLTFLQAGLHQIAAKSVQVANFEALVQATIIQFSENIRAEFLPALYRCWYDADILTAAHDKLLDEFSAALLHYNRQLADPANIGGFTRMSSIAEEVLRKTPETDVAKFLQIVKDSWLNGGMGGRKTDGQSSLRDNFEKRPGPGIVARALIEELIPKISDDQIRRMKLAIEDAQLEPPEDKQQFVDDINRILDVFNLRIQTENGDICRLKFAPGASGRGFIQFSIRSGLSRGGFKNAVFKIESVPPNYVGTTSRKEISHTQK